MPADKELLGPAAILTAALIKAGARDDMTAQAVISIFDEMYDLLDCYRHHKNERTPLKHLEKRLEEFYNEPVQEAAKHPRWHQPVDI